MATVAVGQESAATSKAGPKVDLSDRQESVAERYEKLEELLLRLADMEAAENPDRSALLRRAAKMSRDRFVLSSLQQAAGSLESQQFKDALDHQQRAGNELREVLKLLQSEDRSKRIRDEKERYKRLMADLKRNLNNQRGIRSRTENGAELDQLMDPQRSVKEASEAMRAKLSEENRTIDVDADEDANGSDNEAAEGGPESDDSRGGSDKEAPDEGKREADGANEAESEEDGEMSEPTQPDATPASDGESKEGEAKDGESADAESKDSKPGDTQPSDSKPGDTQPGDSKSNPSKSGESKPSESSPSRPSSQSPPPSGGSESSPPQPQTPSEEVERRVERAVERMQEAEEKLEAAKREEAVEEQMQAEAELRKAIARLEEILRQLREEEMQRTLAKLESRVRRMAAMQQEVLDRTVELAQTPKSQRDRSIDLDAAKLSLQEKKIVTEADRAMLVLREEGSSVAFPEVLSQIRFDMTQVDDLLSRTRIDDLCQSLQQDVLDGLKEMIEALAKAQRDLEQQKQGPQGPQQPSGSGEQPLVRQLEELKLIRTMETRIQKTTDRYARRLQLQDDSPEDILPLLENLSDRQRRLYKITRDLVMKRNQ